MGIYRYTLRAGTKTVGGVEIAHFEYAYKHGWNWEDANRAFVARMAAAGWRAKEKLDAKSVRYFVAAKFAWASVKDSDGVGLAVYIAPGGTGGLPSAYTEEVPERFKRVGTLQLIDGRYHFFNAAEFLVGEFKRDGVPGFYVSVRDAEGNTTHPEFATKAEAAAHAAATGEAAKYCDALDNAIRRRRHAEGVASGRIKVFSLK